MIGLLISESVLSSKILPIDIFSNVKILPRLRHRKKLISQEKTRLEIIRMVVMLYYSFYYL